MIIEQRARISREIFEVARDLKHKYITEDDNIEKLLDLSRELVDDHPRDGDRMLVED